MKKEEFIQAIDNMSVLELNDLVEALKEKFGVTGAPVAVVAPGEDVDVGGADEKSEFNVIIKEIGANKIAVIKEVKAIVGIGLKEAKELVDNPVKPIAENVFKANAEEMKSKLEALGAVIDLV